MSNGKNIRYQFAFRPALLLKRALELVVFRPVAYRLRMAFRAGEVRRRISGFLKPSDNAPLSDAEFAGAKAVCGDIRALLARRDRYISENGLDAGSCLPGANWRGDWKNSALYRGTAALLREDYDILNNLRLFSQVFTGYSLVEMKNSRGVTSPERVPLKLAERLSRVSRRLDEWVGRYWMLAQHLPGALHLSQPARFGEAGWVLDGRIVNHDTYVHLERVALLHEAGELERLGAAAGKNPVILEIGAGFGGLAYHLKKQVPRARYIIVDIPESLVFSAIYLSTLFPDQPNVLATSPELTTRNLDRPGFTFVPNYFAHRFQDAGISADLAINTLSMSEMLPGQVTGYCALIRRCLAPGGVFFEQNIDSRHRGLSNAEHLVAGSFASRRRLSLPTGVVCGNPNLWSAQEPGPPAASRAR
jgi:putative sugar O-methyltransferase